MDSCPASSSAASDVYKRQEQDPDTLRDDYRAALGTIGRQVRVETPSAVLEGVAVDVRPGGELVVDTGGTRHEIGVGDVIHLR